MRRLIYWQTYKHGYSYSYVLPMSHNTTKWLVCPANQSLLCAQWLAKDPWFLHADKKTDETGRMSDKTADAQVLIWVFAGHTGHFVGVVVLQYYYMDRVKRIWYLSPMRAAKVQASLRIRAVSPEPSLLDHTSSESRGTFRQKIRSLVPLNGWACAVKICHDGMLEDTNSLDGAHYILRFYVCEDDEYYTPPPPPKKKLELFHIWL